MGKELALSYNLIIIYRKLYFPKGHLKIMGGSCDCPPPGSAPGGRPVI